MRGAGNLLGAEQHGNLATVGLDLYSELLEEAITEARGEEVEVEVDPEVNVRVPAYIPEGYIPEVSLRLLFYKRLSLAREEDELEELMTELADRFGALPQELEALTQVVRIKLALKKLRLLRLDVGSGVVQVELGTNPTVKPGQIITMLQLYRGRYVLTPDMKLIRKLKPAEASDDLRAARMVCREIMDAAGV
jgi:transcription-repair coupling factor (superfamily II helicase)